MLLCNENAEIQDWAFKYALPRRNRKQNSIQNWHAFIILQILRLLNFSFRVEKYFTRSLQSLMKIILFNTRREIFVSLRGHVMSLISQVQVLIMHTSCDDWSINELPFPLCVLDKPENVNLTVNDSSICKGDIISITCSADGKPDVDTYQLFENDKPVPDGDTTGVWKRTMSAQGIFSYRCVANNTVGTSDKNVTVTVNGN